jgi:uncharacterized protein involved in exopolysaccharide biosynthesis
MKTETTKTNLRAVINLPIWQGFLITGLLSFVVAYSLLSLMPPKYTAVATILPAAKKSVPSGLAQLAGSIGGISGLDNYLSTDSSSLLVLKSNETLGELIQKENLLVLLYPGRWDPREQVWKSSWFSDEPTLAKGIEKLKRKHLTISEDKKTGLITISFKDRNPELAAKLANALVEITNEKIRTKAMQDADANVKYLSEQVATVNEITVQQAIASAMESELKKSALAHANQEFALKFVDHAVKPDDPDYSKLKISLSLSAVFSLIFLSFRNRKSLREIVAKFI